MAFTHKDADKLLANVLEEGEKLATKQSGIKKGTLEKIADVGTLHVEAIKMKVGQAIFNHGLQTMLDQDKGFFFKLDEKAYGKSFVAEVTLQEKHQEGSFYMSNLANVSQYMPTTSLSEDNAGRYGKFFEGLFFGGGAGGSPIPDFRYEIGGTTYGIEIKTAITKDLEEGLDLSWFGHTVGKTSDFKDVLKTLIEDTKDIELVNKVIQATVLKKVYEKMQTLLVAGYDVDRTENSILNVKTGKWEKVTAEGTFYFTILYLFYNLLIQKVYDHVMNYVTVQKSIKKVGDPEGTLENVFKSDKGSVKVGMGEGSAFRGKTFHGKNYQVEVEMIIGNLPKTTEELRKILMDDLDLFYRNNILLFDQRIAEQNAEKFFKSAYEKYKEQHDAGKTSKNKAGDFTWVK